jgi:4-hydroxyphenylpyruvate dioxygenase
MVESNSLLTNQPKERKNLKLKNTDFYGGPGIQHIAIATDDIIKTMQEELNSITIKIPERLGEHMKMMKEDLGEIKVAIMVDADEEGYLLQIFTKPVQDRPTLFLKSFKEWGAKGFGQGTSRHFLNP